MLFFSERNNLAKLFEKWCKENGCAICSVNMVTFLETKGILNEDKVKELLKDEKKC